MKKKLLFAALLALLLALTLWQLDLDSLLHSVSQIQLWLLLLLFGLQIVTQLLLNLQWCLLAKFSSASLSFSKMLYINSQGSVVDSITPGVKIGGELTRAVQISRLGNCSGEQAAAVVAMQKLFSLSSFFLISLFTVGFLLGSIPALQSPALQSILYGALLLLLFLFACIFLAPHRIQAGLQGKEPSRFGWMKRLHRFFLTLLRQVSFLRQNKRAWAGLFALSLFIWLLYPAKMYVLLIQVAQAVSLPQLTAIVFAAYLVAMIPLFPGGLVGFEATMSGLLLGLGIAFADAAVATLVFRFFTFWLVTLLGFAFLAFYKVSQRRKAVRL